MQTIQIGKCPSEIRVKNPLLAWEVISPHLPSPCGASSARPDIVLGMKKARDRLSGTIRANEFGHEKSRSDYLLNRLTMGTRNRAISNSIAIWGIKKPV